MQHIDEQQKPLAARGRPRSHNQPDEENLIRVGNRLPGCVAIDSQDHLPPALEATKHLVRYFDNRGGFWRIGRLISSHAVTRGRHKGRVTLTIATALNQRLTRNTDEVETVQ